MCLKIFDQRRWQRHAFPSEHQSHRLMHQCGQRDTLLSGKFFKLLRSAIEDGDNQLTLSILFGRGTLWPSW